MAKPKTSPTRIPTHLWVRIKRLARQEDKTGAAMHRTLLKEALMARKDRQT